MIKALFLDRDGTINKYGEYIHTPQQFEFIDGAIDFIKKFNQMGYKVFVVSNQAGIGRGYYTEKDLLSLQNWVNDELNKYGAKIDEWFYCPHHPVYGIGDYKIDCDCRKPKSGMLLKAIKKYNIDVKNSLMVGDKEWDALCAERIGLKSFLLKNEDYSALNIEVDKYIESSKKTVDVSIIIVNYNTPQLVIDAINSVKEKTEKVTYEIILIDNASKDDSLIKIRTAFPQVRLISSQENLGFGKANNRAAKFAKGRYLLLLNNDVLLINDAISVLTQYLDENKDVAVVGGNLYSVDYKPANSMQMEFPSFKEILNLRLLNWRFRSKKYRSLLYMPGYNDTEKVIDVAFVSGADLMIRREVFDEIGGFDKDFFMYYEETEMCYRIKQLGYKIKSIPYAKIIHIDGGSFGKGFNPSRYAMYIRSYFLYYEKVYKKKFPRTWYIAYRLSQILWSKKNNNLKAEGKVLKQEYKDYLRRKN